MSDSVALPAGTQLGAYRIIRCIGTGGMGAVYEAEHRELRKRVALKTPYTEAGSSPEGRARFVQEGKTASRLRHPHVVDITDVGEADDIAYLVMEYLEGEPLSARIVRDGPLPPHVIADTLVPVAAALEEAHGMGIIHRDLKPDNIFLTRSVQGNLHPKILDFGISKVLGDEASPRLTSTSNVMLGTPNYISPEQLETPHAITGKSDQYSLGVVIYEAATGNNPFAGHRSLMSILRAIGKGDYPLPRDLNAEIDPRLERVALRAMSVSPGARYASMAALAAELLPLASPETRTAWARYFAPISDYATVASSVPRSQPRTRRRRWSWLLVASALGAAATGVTVFRATSRSPLTHVEVRTLPSAPPSSQAPSSPAAASEAPRAALDEPLARPAPAARGNVSVSQVPGPHAEPARAGELPGAAPRRASPSSGRPSREARSGAARGSSGEERAAERTPSASGEPAPPSGAPSDPRDPRDPRDQGDPRDQRSLTRPPEALRTDNVDPWDPR